MAGLTIFHYFSGNSFFHRHSPVLKTGELIIAVSLVYFSNAVSLVLFMGLLITVIIYTGIPFLTLIREFRLFIWLLIIIFIAAFFSEQYPTIPQNLAYGIMESLRFVNYILAGFLYTRTTDPDKFYGIIYTLLSPVPFVPHKKIAAFFKIIFSLLPKAIDTLNEVNDSISSRNLQNSKNPVRRTINTVYPVLVDLIIKTDNLSDAIAARGFEGIIKYHPDINKNKNDFFFCVLICIVMTGLYYIPLKFIKNIFI